MSAHHAQHRVPTMCRVLEVSTSGYYAWRKRPASKRAQANAVLLRQIRTSHAASDGTYGVPRIHAELAAAEVRVSRKRVARLMRAAGIVGVHRRRWIATTTRTPDRRPAPDLVQRTFRADGPNRLWVADATYIPTWAGFLFLAIVLDVFSRKVTAEDMALGYKQLMRVELAWRQLKSGLRMRKVGRITPLFSDGARYRGNGSRP